MIEIGGWLQILLNLVPVTDFGIQVPTFREIYDQVSKFTSMV